MNYPKQIMSITELKEMGFSKYQLRLMVKDPKAPTFRRNERGKTYFDTSKLDDYLRASRDAKAAQENNNKMSWAEKKKMLLRS